MYYQAESVWEFSSARNVTFGVGAVEELGDVIQSLDGDRVLVITDEGVAEAGPLAKVTDQFDEVHPAIFDTVVPEPPLSVFKNALARAEAFEPDVIIGLGGGSPMDVAKTTAIVQEQEGEITDFIASPTGAGKQVSGPGLPVIAVPTTAGTGAETSPVSVISLPEEQLKVGISSRFQRPEIALIDPALTVSLPPGPTAASGLDALAHAIESYVTRRYDAKPAATTREERPNYNGRSPITNLFSRDAIRRIGANLRDAVNNGEDLQARHHMALGSLQAGLAFTNAGLGATHAIAMAAGAIHDTSHGVTIAMTLPAVMRFNLPSSRDRYTEIARFLSQVDDRPHDWRDDEQAARSVEQLAEEVGIEGGLTTLGIEESDVAYIAEQASKLDRLLAGNPRRLNSSDLESIIRESL